MWMLRGDLEVWGGGEGDKNQFLYDVKSGKC